ncbi:AMP-binding protein [Pyxidicoccus fallax]|uniref:AMP-binding protein n=1 Tax=Pyxidicoccus fallax TaxID=394095 RepID=A0A848LLW8_9BACT|nr:AMP-binding protein [Pyxidicoccus fallax]NMO18643.1 AMP-binding protein [Pyxidicoccus fallax]NPC79048.1 AMP-binding protein [Pyxidicoccus fallax]
MSFDFRAILQQVEQAAPAEALPDWLQRSWTDPEGFAAALAPAHAGRGAPFKSRTGQHHDFFHDLIGRHATTERIALRAYDRAVGWRTLSYRQLHEQAARRATAWEQRGVKPGARVCLLYHPGPELWVSLGAALGLGACVSLLPPVGRRFVSRRLAVLDPEHVAAEPHQAPFLGPYAPRLLPTAGPATPALASHSYKPEARVGLLFSPLVNPPSTPVPLRAGDAWLGALVDGALTFALAPGDHLAAPGFHPLQHLPALIFTTLLRGATYLHLELSDLEERPTLLTEYPVRALGVTPALRDLLLRTRTPLRNVGGWFRNPEGPLDWQAWRAWVKGCGLESVPCSNVLVDAAAGGAVLASPRRVGDVHTEVAPAPGRRWALKDLNGSGQPAAGDMGLFTLLPAEGRPPGHVVLSCVRQRYHYGGTLEPRREGRVLPAAEVTEALEGVEPPCSTSLLTVPTGGLGGELRSVLLVFTGSPSEGAQPSLAELRRRFELQLGTEFVPDRFEVFPLYPRLREGRVDDAWCHTQYLTGALYQKAGAPLFQTLTALRARLRQAPGAH